MLCVTSLKGVLHLICYSHNYSLDYFYAVGFFICLFVILVWFVFF